MNEAELYIVIGIMVIIICVLATKLGQAHYKLDKKELELLRFKGINFASELDRLIAASKSENKKPQISKTTEQLLILAVKNANEHESRAAAIKACKRIYKELDIKS